MRFIAQFDLIGDVSASDDIDQQPVEHPNGDFKFIIRRKTVVKDSDVVTLHCNMEFEATALEEARERLLDYAVMVMDALVLATQASVRFHRLYKIFDWTPGTNMRRGIVYVYDPPASEPEPFLTRQVLDTVAVLLKAEVGEKVRSALRWFRWGVAADTAEDQFRHLWFALEFLALNERPTETVHDACPKCHGPLYCETCNEHPRHLPYPKQAIEHLCAKTAPDIPEFFPIADKVRNMMMHGASVASIEEKIGRQLHEIVDPLGRIVWMALLNTLLHSLPPDPSLRELSVGEATTLVKLDMSAAVVLETMVPLGPQGEPDIELLTGLAVGFSR